MRHTESLATPDSNIMLQDFLTLSQILTGVENLDAELGRQYLDRLTSTPFDPVLRQILEQFGAMQESNDWSKMKTDFMRHSRDEIAGLEVRLHSSEGELEELKFRLMKK